MRRLEVAIAVAVLAVAVCPARGAIFTFGDNTKYWTGWGNGTQDDAKDSIGVPNFFSGTAGAILTGGSGDILTSLSVQYDTALLSVHNLLVPGDLFLDIDSDQDWDYVVRTNSFLGQNPTASEWAVYDFTGAQIALGSETAYQLSNESVPRLGTGYWNWSRFNIREEHPWALAADTLSDGVLLDETVTFSGWVDNAKDGVSTWDFTSLTGGGISLPANWNLTIGFTVNCANDVLYETIEGPGESHLVPEASAFLIWCILGASAVMVGRWRRRAATTVQP